jgi:hypothetical protein
LLASRPYAFKKYNVVDPVDPDPDPALQGILDLDTGPYPDPIRNKGFDDQKLFKNVYFFIKNCNFLISRPSQRTSKLQEKPSALKENVQHFKNEIYLLFYIFMGNFCPPGSGSGLRIRMWIRMQGPH